MFVWGGIKTLKEREKMTSKAEVKRNIVKLVVIVSKSRLEALI
jgi:hypothetical protein